MLSKLVSSMGILASAIQQSFKSFFSRFSQNLLSKFKLKDLCCIKNCLGVRVVVDKQMGTISTDQKSYIEKLLLMFNILYIKLVYTIKLVGYSLFCKSFESV